MFLDPTETHEIDAAPRGRLRETRTPHRGCRPSRAVARIVDGVLDVDVSIPDLDPDTLGDLDAGLIPMIVA